MDMWPRCNHDSQQANLYTHPETPGHCPDSPDKSPDNPGQLFFLLRNYMQRKMLQADKLFRTFRANNTDNYVIY